MHTHGSSGGNCHHSIPGGPIEPDPGEHPPAACEFPALARLESAIGTYEIKGGKLGEGGFGVVWLADDGSEWVAVKVPRTRPTSQEWQRYVSEVTALAKLPPHPHIVRLRDYGKDGDTYFIVLEYKNADPLEFGQQRSLRTTVQIIARIAAAVAHMHLHGIAHRDISPKNILIDKSDDATPYLLDFGFAKSFHQEPRYSQDVTTEGQIVGNRRYMSPEQRLGEEGYDLCRSDVFSLGIIFFQLMTGEYPFDGDSVADQLMRKDSSIESANALPSIHDATARHLPDVIERCLQKDPRKRYASATELLAAIETPALRISGHARRPRLLAWCITVVASLGLLLYGIDFFNREADPSAGIPSHVEQSNLINLTDSDPSPREANQSIESSPESEAVVRSSDNKTRLHINARFTSWPSLSPLLRQYGAPSDPERLTNLTLASANVQFHDADFAEFTELYAIEVSHCTVKWNIQQATILEYLAFTNCRGIEEFRADCLPKTKSIKFEALPIRSITGLETTSAIALFLDNLPRLESAPHLGQCGDLRFVSVIDCPKLDEDLLAEIGRLPHLRTLWVGATRDRSLVKLVHCQDLQSLALTKMSELVDLGALSQLKRLRKVLVSGCPKVDWSTLPRDVPFELYGDEPAVDAIQSKQPNFPIRAELEYWNWTHEMLSRNIAAGRYYDEFID